MNLLHLKYVVEVAKQGSLNKAAEKLLVAQPNLSRSVKELEGELGITIFDRSAKGMFLTPDGQEFIGYAKKILDQIDEVEKIYKSGYVGKARFSVSVPRASYVGEALSKLSLDLSEKAVEIYYKETNSWRTIKNVLSSEYKLGIVRYGENYDKFYKAMFDEKNLSYSPVGDFEYRIIMNKECPLAQKECISSDDLHKFIEVAHGDPFVPNMAVEDVRKMELDEKIKRRIFVFDRASQYEILSENNETFMWVSPMPQKALDFYGLVQRPCVDIQRRYRDMLIYRKDYNLSDIDKLFLEKLAEAKGNCR